MEQETLRVKGGRPALRPYRFRPYLKETIWGGDRIAPFKGMSAGRSGVGESWELSGMPGCESVVADGEDAGLTLTQLIERHGAALVGARALERCGGRFPLLVKLIDARDDLSVQVHPDDALAAKRHGSRGKTEMWYVVDADSGAKIRAGLRRPLSPAEYGRMVTEAGGGAAFVEALATYDAQPDDLFFLPAGTLHAIGAGNLIAEIQQASDVTYRVYDYDRRDARGRTRELHVELAKDAIDWCVRPSCRTDYDRAASVATLVDCPFFRTYRAVVRGASAIDLKTDAFAVALCLAGAADVNGVAVRQGETLLVPAADGVLRVEGEATLLCATV